jgi:hypothetical protein
MDFPYTTHNWTKDDNNQVFIDEEFPPMSPQYPLDSQLIASTNLQLSLLNSSREAGVAPTPVLGEPGSCPDTEEAPPSMLGDMVHEATHLEIELNPSEDTVPKVPPVQLLRESSVAYLRPKKGCC